MYINIPSNVEAVLERLESCGFEAFIVGGCVRDSLLGMTPKDYDVTTNARPEQMIKCFETDHKVIETGLKHGTVTVVSKGDNIEVTAYRVDGAYTDRRRPDSVEFTSRLEDDLSRRDFTINAMAYSHKRGLVDIFDGREDLENKILRCVGNPVKRFEEDALRIMRALRFSSRLGFAVEDGTAGAIHDCKELLREISCERILSELSQFLMGESPCELMLRFSDVFGVIIPETIPCVGFDQRSRYHAYDVWEHTARAVENSAKDKFVRMALLFHDIAKPSCFYEDKEGRGHFTGHEKTGAQMSEQILKRMHSDNEMIKNVKTLIAYHDSDPSEDRRVIRKMISGLGFERFMRLTEVMKADNRAKQAFCLERVETLERMADIARDIENKGDCCTLKALAVSGSDLEEAGIRGKKLGRILSALLDSVINDELPNEREALINKALQLQ